MPDSSDATSGFVVPDVPAYILLAAAHGGETERHHFWKQRVNVEERMRHGGAQTLNFRCARGFPHLGNNNSVNMESSLRMDLESASDRSTTYLAGAHKVQPEEAPVPAGIVLPKPTSDLLCPHFGPIGELKAVPRVRRTREVPWGPPAPPRERLFVEPEPWWGAAGPAALPVATPSLGSHSQPRSGGSSSRGGGPGAEAPRAASRGPRPASSARRSTGASSARTSTGGPGQPRGGSTPGGAPASARSAARSTSGGAPPRGGAPTGASELWEGAKAAAPEAVGRASPPKPTPSAAQLVAGATAPAARKPESARGPAVAALERRLFPHTERVVQRLVK